MDPVDCLEVCEFIIEQARGLNRALNVRHLLNGFQDYLQFAECEARCDWHDLVATRLKERPLGLGEVRTLTERVSEKERELALAAELDASGMSRSEKAVRWQQETGKSEKTLYRRIAEAKQPR